MILAFIDEMRAEGYAAWSICRVLIGQGLKVAARTYRLWKQQGRKIADGTHTDAQVLDTVRDACWTTITAPDGTTRPRTTPEGLYRRRKMLARSRRQIPDVSRGAVDRAMRALGLVGVSRAKAIRTTIPSKDGRCAGDLLNRDFPPQAGGTPTAPRPDHTWVADVPLQAGGTPTYVRTWAGWVDIAFIVDVFAQMIVGWHAMTTRDVDLVMIPLRMALWNRSRTGHPVGPGQLQAHSDAGSQYTSITYTDKLALDGIAPSIGSVGDAYDNALMECVNGLGAPPACGGDKAECIRTTIFHEGPFRTIADVEIATAGWVDRSQQPPTPR